MRLIGITGRAKSGKDTSAGIIREYFQNQNKSVDIYSFASPLKKIARDIFKFSDFELNTPDGKESHNNFWDITPRKFLQILGTDMFRNVFRDDVWLKCAELYLTDNMADVIIIPDVRFNNEAEFIKKYKGIIIQIYRSNWENDFSGHVSEQGIDDKYLNWSIYNNYSINELRDIIFRYFSHIDEVNENQ